MATNKIQVEIKNLREIEEYLDQLPEEAFDDAKRTFAKYILKAQTIVERNTKWRLKKRTGSLSRSIGTQVKGTSLKTLDASIFSRFNVGAAEVVYAPIHEFGGTINAIRAYARVPGGPYLNIPTKANQTPAGVTRLQPREVFFAGLGHIRRTKSGKWGVFIANTMMFVLVKRVHIPPRLGMRTAVDRQVSPLLRELAELIGRDR